MLVFADQIVKLLGFESGLRLIEKACNYDIETFAEWAERVDETTIIRASVSCPLCWRGMERNGGET